MPNPPASFTRDGFVDYKTARRSRFLPGLKRPGVMIQSQGQTDSGKSEFMFSMPGPAVCHAVDPHYDALADNPNPPPSRRLDEWFIKEYKAPTSAMQGINFLATWQEYVDSFYKSLSNTDAMTVAVDGDAYTWNWQRMAFLGKLQGVMSLQYVEVNAARIALLTRAFQCGKHIIFTNTVTPEYVDELDAMGKPVKDEKGRNKRVKSGEFEKQGFDGGDYLFDIRIQHMVKDAREVEVKGRTVSLPREWGIKILKAKANPAMVGEELWGDLCNFESLMALLYPDVESQEWGLR